MTEETQVQNNENQSNENDLEEILNVVKESVKSSALNDPWTNFLATMNTMIKNNNVIGMKKLFAGYFIKLNEENSEDLLGEYLNRKDDLGYIAKTVNAIYDTKNIREILKDVVGEDVVDKVIKDYENRGLLEEIKRNATVQYLRRSDNEKIKNAFVQWKQYIADIGGYQFKDKIAKYFQ